MCCYGKLLRLPLTNRLRLQLETIPLLGTFLRKNHRALKLNSLSLLDTLVLNYSALIDPNLLNKAITEIPPLLSELDLHVAQLSMVLLTSTANLRSSALVNVHATLLPEILTLIRSPLLQGTALNCTLSLFQAFVKTNLPGLSYRELLEMIKYPIMNPNQSAHLHKQAFHSSAKCVAALTLQCHSEAIPLAVDLLQDIQKRRNDSQAVFCLLSIGEIGRHL